MEIIPVLDLKAGRVVRAVGGRREQYRPLLSSLVQSCEPLTVAQAFRQTFGSSRLYVADLDAISGQLPNLELLTQLVDEGFGLLVDIGVREAQELPPLLQTGLQTVVIGSETLLSVTELRQAVELLGSHRLVFSFDFDGDVLRTPIHAWQQQPLSATVESVLSLGVSNLLFLDLQRVGQGQGLAVTEPWRAWTKHEQVRRLLVGGGVTGPGDLDRLAEQGVAAVLVASALHDGRLSPAVVRSFHQFTADYGPVQPSSASMSAPVPT